MRFPIRAHQIPPRLLVGAFVLNSGLSKLKAVEDVAAGVHGTATGAYPFLGKQDPEAFTRRLGTAEVAVGVTLLAPVVPSLVAGAALTGFAAGLCGLYLRLPGMHEEGSLRPTQQGIPLAKDSWLVGIGAGLILDDLNRIRHHRRHRRHGCHRH